MTYANGADVTMQGSHDQFPSWSVWANKQPVYLFSASTTFGPLASFTPTMSLTQEAVNRTQRVPYLV